MTLANLPHHRLHSQCIAATTFDDPAGPVRWLGAIQAQDYLGSLWASTSARAYRPSSHAFLLPAFDEYIVAYRDRVALVGLTRLGTTARRAAAAATRRYATFLGREVDAS
jgi:hypothetical protein